MKRIPILTVAVLAFVCAGAGFYGDTVTPTTANTGSLGTPTLPWGSMVTNQIDAGTVSAAVSQAGSYALTSDTTHLAPVVTSSTAQESIEHGRVQLSSGVGSVVFAPAFSAIPFCTCSSTNVTVLSGCAIDAGLATNAGFLGDGGDFITWVCIGAK